LLRMRLVWLATYVQSTAIVLTSLMKGI